MPLLPILLLLGGTSAATALLLASGKKKRSTPHDLDAPRRPVENSVGASDRATNPDGSPMSEKDARYWADLALPDEKKNARYLATLLPRPIPLTRRKR